MAFWTHPRLKLAVFCLCSTPLPASAQNATSRIRECAGPRQSVSGTVTDTTGALIPFATVKVSCGSSMQQTKADEKGVYRLSLSAGNYTVVANADGYAPLNDQLSIEDSSRQTAPPLVLTIASANTAVNVIADDGMTASFATVSTKTDTPILEQPFAITSITHDQIAQQNPQSVVDTIAYTAGAQTLSANGPAIMAVDSFSLRGAAADEYLDGMRIPQSFNAAQSGPASLQLDPDDMEHIDILLGPSSTLYGQSNLGGIVDAVSKQPSEIPYRSLQLQIGSYDRYQGGATVSGPFNRSGSLLYGGNGIFRRSNTYVYGMQDDRATLNSTITWHPSLNTTLNIYGKYLRNSSQSLTAYVPYLGTVQQAPFGYLPVSVNVSDPTYDRYRKNQLFAGYSIDHKGAGRWQVRHQLRYVHMNANIHFLYLASMQADGVTANRLNYSYAPRIEGVQSDSHAQTILRTGKFRHTLLGGLDFQWQRYRYQQALPPATSINITAPAYRQGDTVPAPTVSQRQTQFQGGMYGQEQIDISHFTIVAGGRVDFTAQDTFSYLTNQPVNAQSPHAFSGHAGISYHVSGFAPYFSYSTSFLPTLGADLHGQPYVPITGSNVEGGVKYQLTRMPLMLRVTGFSMRQQNTLEPDPDLPGNSVQTGEVHTPGAEVQVNGTALRSLDYTVTYTHIKPVNTVSETTQGKQPVTVSNNTASTWLHYTFRRGLPAGVGVGAGTRFAGASWATVTNSLRVPGFTLFDAALDYTMESWRFAVNAKNVGDRRYINGCSNQYFCAYGASRTVVGSASYRF